MPNIPLPLLTHNAQSSNVLSLTASIEIDHQNLYKCKSIVLAEWKAIKATNRDAMSISTKKNIF